jgi:hypothetical protein
MGGAGWHHLCDEEWVMARKGGNEEDLGELVRSRIASLPGHLRLRNWTE